MTDPEIVTIYELDNGPLLYYQCCGHVEPARFVAMLESQWDKSCPADQVQRVWIHNVPRPEYGAGHMEQMIYHAPGRGRTPRTQVHCLYCDDHAPLVINMQSRPDPRHARSTRLEEKEAGEP